MNIDEFMTTYPNIGKILSRILDTPEIQEDLKKGFDNVKKTYSHNQLQEMDYFLEFGNISKKEKEELEDGTFYILTENHPEWEKIETVDDMLIMLVYAHYRIG